MVKINASSLVAYRTPFEDAWSSTAVSGTADWRDRHETSFALSRHGRLADLLAAGLDRRLRSFRSALESFKWPDNAKPLFNARLAVTDGDLKGKVLAEIRTGNDLSRYYKYFSSGFDKWRPTDLEAGDYTFSMTLGGKSGESEENAGTEKVTFTVEDGYSHGDVLEAVRDAVNDSALPVQAEIVTQNSPGFRVKGLNRTGTILALSVNGAYQAQELTLSDEEGHAIRELDMAATLRPVLAATPSRYDVTGLTTAKKSAYSSADFDPNETTTLAAGDYSLTVSIGAHSADLTVTVESDDDWTDVMRAISNAVSSADTGAKASYEFSDLPYYDPRFPNMIERQRIRLTVQAEAPKVGERLSIEEDVSASPDGSTSILGVLGLDATAVPGSDAKMVINGREEVRAPGLFQEDKGRLGVSLLSTFGEPLPVRVVEAFETMEERLRIVADAYDSVQSYLFTDPALWKDGVAEELAAPAAGRWDELEWLGMRRTNSGELWVNGDAFYLAMRRDPERAELALSDKDSGLVPQWLEVTDDLLSRGGKELLVGGSSLERRHGSLNAALRNEYRSLVMDLFG